MAMKSPPHPGLSVSHDSRSPLGFNVTATAVKLGICHKQLSDIVFGHVHRDGDPTRPSAAARIYEAYLDILDFVYVGLEAKG